MMKKRYNKLVRDKIPAIIEEHGEEAVTYIATEKEYWQALLAKLQEEVAELIASDGAAEELADVLEVLKAIADYQSLEMADVRRLQRRKRKIRGGFRRRIILKATR